ncbi:hypothetical protein LINPERHAP1_LOCUS26068 [Linum perenne]
MEKLRRASVVAASLRRRFTSDLLKLCISFLFIHSSSVSSQKRGLRFQFVPKFPHRLCPSLHSDHRPGNHPLGQHRRAPYRRREPLD